MRSGRIPPFVALIALLAVGPVAAQTVGPTLTLAPNEGPAGTVVHALGSGFDQTSCGVDLYLDDTTGDPLGTTTIDNGAFDAEITIPADEPDGEHIVIAVGLDFSGEFCGVPSGDEGRAPFLVGEMSPGPFVVEEVTPVLQDIDLSTLPPITPWQEGDPVRVGPGQELPGEEEPPAQLGTPAAGTGASATPNAMRRQRTLQPRVVAAGPFQMRASARDAGPMTLSAPLVSVDGVPATGVLPPDVSGDVGPDHYIQAANAAFMIFDKSGSVLAGPSNINGLWTGVGGPCETNNDGDPDVRYDPIADRWVVMQFVAYTDFCIAVSQTPDPVAGGWFLYDFNTGSVANDYPKIGVWPDAYYAGSQRGYPGSGTDAWAFDRTSMLAGAPATAIRFFDSGTFLLPADLDGAGMPPAGAPELFVRQVDDAQFGGVDRLELFEFHVDFVTPANSTFTALADLPTAAFDRDMCGFGLLTPCIPQPGTAQALESMTAWPMSRLQYRNSGGHETLVVNHGVDADGSDHAGVRWYELRKSGGAWSIFQQATHAPDGGVAGLADDPQRWMASAAMDGHGNLAIAYSVSSASVFPGLRYAARLESDPAGTLPLGESTLIAGGGSQTHGSGRWGDYSSLTVDPVDDCTMWFSSEYYAATSTAGWRTRVASFRVDDVTPTATCPADVAVECSATGGTPADDPQLAAFLGGASATDDCDLEPTISSDEPALIPLGDTPVTFTATDDNGNAGSCSATVTVADTMAPTIEAPDDLADVECTSPLGASPDLGMPTVADVCDDMPLVANDAPDDLPLGTTIVTWTATDAGGNVGMDTQSVEVVDTTPPEFTLTLSPTELWPPNHKFVTITATIMVDDVCDPDPTVRLVSIVSNEPADDHGDGHTEPDIAGADLGTDDRQFELRAERQGGGDGRVYTVTYSVEDASGNTTLRQAEVLVPHNQ